LVLDKTGTITTGEPRVIKTHYFDATNINILASMESNSTHPLARAICQHYSELELVKIENFENFPGMGISGSYGGQAYFGGKKQFIVDQGITFNNDHAQDSENSLVYFSNEKELLEVIEIGDELKPDIEKHLKTLAGNHIKVHLLSGDNILAVSKMANKLGVLNFKGEVLPEEKADYINSLKSMNKIVAMVGDGINDTIAFTQADVSIAMSNGADAAKEVADITILGHDLSRVISSIQLSKNTTAVVNQNLFWAFIYNILAIPVATGVLYNSTGFMMQPMLASAAMALSSISVVSNSLRLKFKKI
jgi:Cu2+-exporting ATPase